MKKQISTKRALLFNLLSMVLCLSMLVGSTFAWFTDTASTAVNQIQSGTLDVDIVDQNGNSLDGKTLSFRNVDGETDILWEPGATFRLDSFRIVNKGNLALKYKVLIRGIDGDAKLLEAIDFTVKKGSAAATVLADWEGVLLPAGATSADADEEIGETDLITISVTMKKDAGNEYMNETLDGIGILLVATQYTAESDSNGNRYDENAEYPVSNSSELSDAIANAGSGDKIIVAPGNYSIPAATFAESLTFTGSGIGKTVLKTTQKNQVAKNAVFKDVTIDGRNNSSLDNNGVIKLEGRDSLLDGVEVIGGGTNTYGHSVRAGENTTIRSSYIHDAFRAIQAYDVTGVLLIEDSVLAPQCYALNIDGGTGKLIVNNSVLKGWTSYTDTIESATFTGCTFEKNTDAGSYGYNYLCAYTTTTLKNCTFGEDFQIGAGATGVTFTIENCTYNGVRVTAENIEDMLDVDDTLKGCTILVDGVAVTW